MALIKCPECGKEFSDRAAACPNCGCPTSEIKVGEADSARTKAETQMIAAVERTLRELSAAEKTYEQDCNKTSALAAKTINWSSPQAKAQISELLEAEAKANVRMYQACQSMIPILDGNCRPLLSGNPGANAAKAVAETIALLNKKSQVQFSIKLSINWEDYGNVVTRDFVPSSENLTIQGFWEAVYAGMPNHAEAEQFWQGLTAKLKKEEQDAKNAVKKATMSRYEAADEQVKAWERETERIKKRREDELNARLEEKRTALKKEIETAWQTAQRSAETQSKEAADKKKKAEKALSELGLFKFAERSEQKKRIREADEALAKAKDLREEAEKVHGEKLAAFDQRIETEKTELQREIKNRYPLPERPLSGQERDILKYIGNKELTASDLAHCAPFVQEQNITFTRLEALLTSLVNREHLFSRYEGRTKYYSIYTSVDDVVYSVDDWKKMKKEKQKGKA